MPCFITYQIIYKQVDKSLYSAARFIFGFCGSALHLHMLPHLKSLHFLPVRFSVACKIVLLTHKCLHDYAQTYLKNLINSRSLFRQDTA